jgi:hypothetical protein
MKATEFCYWMQGFFELNETKIGPLTEKQVEVIKNHLNMVFIHDIDPSYPNKNELNKAHEGKPKISTKPYTGGGFIVNSNLPVMRC